MQWVTQYDSNGTLPDRVPPFEIPAYQLVPRKDPWDVAALDPAEALAQALAFGDPAPDATKPDDEAEPIKHDHKKKPGDDAANDEAMVKLKAIWDWILKNAADNIARLNEGIVEFNVSKDRTKYDAARYEFIEFLDGLDNPHPKNDAKHRGSNWNGVTMKWASIKPVYGLCDFVAGAKVVARWAGGSHSSAGSVSK